MYKQNTFMNWVNKCQVFGFTSALQLIKLTKCSLDELSVISETLQRHSQDKAVHI